MHFHQLQRAELEMYGDTFCGVDVDYISVLVGTQKARSTSSRCYKEGGSSALFFTVKALLCYAFISHQHCEIDALLTRIALALHRRRPPPRL